MQNRCTEKDPEECVDDDNGPWSEDSMNGCDSPPPEEKPDECQPHENDALNPWDEEEDDDCDQCPDVTPLAKSNTNKNNDGKNGCCQNTEGIDGKQSCGGGKECNPSKDGNEACGSSNGCQPAKQRVCPSSCRPANGAKAPDCQECHGGKVQKTPEGKEIPCPCCQKSESQNKNNSNDCDCLASQNCNCNNNNQKSCGCDMDSISDNVCGNTYQKASCCGTEECRCQKSNNCNCNNNNNNNNDFRGENDSGNNKNNNCGCSDRSTNQDSSCGKQDAACGNCDGAKQRPKRECPSLMRPTNGSKAQACAECKGSKVKKTTEGKEIPCPCCQSEEAKKRAAELADKGKSANASGNNSCDNKNNNNDRIERNSSSSRGNLSDEDESAVGSHATDSNNNQTHSQFEVSLNNGKEVVTRYFDDPSSTPPSLCPQQETKGCAPEPACPAKQPPPPPKRCESPPPQPSCSQPQPSCSQPQPSCSQPQPSCQKAPSCRARDDQCPEEKSLLERLIEKDPDQCCDLGPVPYDACAAERFFDKEDPRPKECKKKVPKCGVESQAKNPFVEWFASQDPCPRKPGLPPHPSCAAGCGADPPPPSPPPPYPCCPAESPKPTNQCSNAEEQLELTTLACCDSPKVDAAGGTMKMQDRKQIRSEEDDMEERRTEKKKKSLKETAVGKFIARHFCGKCED